MGERVEDPSRVKNLERSELSNRLGRRRLPGGAVGLVRPISDPLGARDSRSSSIMNAKQTTTLGFEVYRDDANEQYGEEAVFAVLTNPGPDVPRGTLAAVQDAVDDSDLGLENGEGGDAGTVEYVPGKDDGEVVDVDVQGVQ